MRGEHPAVSGDNAVLFVDQHRVGEAKFADRGGDLRDLLVAVRARVFRRRGSAPRTGAEQSSRGNVTGKPRLCFIEVKKSNFKKIHANRKF